MNDYTSFKSDFLKQLEQYEEVSIPNVVKVLNNLMLSYSVKKNTLQQENNDELPQAYYEFIAAKTIEEKTPSTIKLYSTILKIFFKSCPVQFNSITTNDIRLFLKNYKIERKVSNSTIETIRRVLNSFYEWCLNEQFVTHNPIANIAPIKCEIKPRLAMKPIELEYIRKACINSREKALVDFLFSTGCRISEVSNAKLKDIDWIKRTILIHNGKGNKSRYTYLNAECEVSLREYLDQRKVESPYVFAPLKKTKNLNLSTKALADILKKITARIDNKLTVKITPHVFRHTSATIALKNGMPIEQVQKFLGHSNINTTMIYAEIDNDSIRLSHDKYLS